MERERLKEIQGGKEKDRTRGRGGRERERERERDRHESERERERSRFVKIGNIKRKKSFIWMF